MSKNVIKWNDLDFEYDPDFLYKFRNEDVIHFYKYLMENSSAETLLQFTLLLEQNIHE